MRSRFILILMLMLVSHFMSCLWILIGLQNYYSDPKVGWIQVEVESGMLTDDFPSLYVVSLYWVITTFSSIGYGEITPITEGEIEFTLLIQMLGIGIYGYMISTIQ